MPIIKDCLGRDVVVYNHSGSFEDFYSAIRKAVCKACEIPEKLLKDVEWTNPHHFGFISPANGLEGYIATVFNNHDTISKSIYYGNSMKDAISTGEKFIENNKSGDVKYKFNVHRFSKENPEGKLICWTKFEEGEV